MTALDELLKEATDCATMLELERAERGSRIIGRLSAIVIRQRRIVERNCVCDEDERGKQYREAYCVSCRCEADCERIAKGAP